MISAFIASQILVGVVILTDFISFQFKDRKKIVFFLCISAALIAVHYFLLGKNTAGVLVSISILRFIVAYFSTHKFFMFSILGITVLAFIFTYSAPLSFLILACKLFTTVGTFQKNDKFLRISMMVGGVFVIIYDVLIFSPMAVLLGVLFVISNLLGYYRFYIRGSEKIQVE